MPELPEVEIAARGLRRWCQGARIERAEVHHERAVEGAPREFRAALRGAELQAVRRHGKNLFVELDAERALWIHLGMSGKLCWRPPRTLAPSHTRITLHFGDGRLCLRDPRILGGMATGSRSAIGARRRRLGPDAYGIGDKALQACFPAASRVAIKVALMDQKRLAGVGNIQAAEALHRAGVHPERSVQSLEGAEWRRLASALRQSFDDTLAATDAPEVAYMSDGAHVENPFRVYGRKGEPCPRCAVPIERYVLRGRATYFCARCQELT